MKRERKVILYIAMSLDGYIARKNGDIDWLCGDGSEPDSDFGYKDFYEGIDTVILGKTTYDQVVNELSVGVWPYEGIDSFVFTSKDIENNKDVKFIKEDICAFINNLKKREGKDIWIVGGAELVRHLTEVNLIDEYIITVIPTILGEGISLFKEGSKELKLKLRESKVYNGAVMINYIRD
ncbi:dihydrofolate reductase family protein [Clostridium sp. CCUG 7971]|uniref:dihydrofolate reductase family protein n=1 Tax=Clostridium sp. CCUG 7971 TaxID=2811414 RepID=UPI001ABB6298|nr:dihydrofolate reductase family protein [Clostridium sp. CCUG 7971]MBO3442976.1 dihydrofolate reductase [Clostridium sp. CCUG 7971]